MDFKNLSNEELALQAKDAVGTETSATVNVIRYFRELQNRRVYAERGYSSMFDMAKRYFGYSEAAANRRVSAMWLIEEAPELEMEIESGNLSLTTAALVQSFCTRNDKDVREVAARVAGKSSREVQREFLKIVPNPVPEERVKQVTEEHTAITVIVDRELLALLNHLIAIRSHANPSCKYTQLIRQLAELGEKAWDPARKAKREQRKTPPALESRPESPKSEQSRTRALGPQKSQKKYFGVQKLEKPKLRTATRREVFREAGYQCTFIDPQTGKRCGSKHFLQIDHIIPKALGGTDAKENLRALCRTHNLLAAVHKLGLKVMAPYLRH